MNKKFLTFLKFFLPILVWLFLFRKILSGTTPLLTEPFNMYAMVKFYLDNLQQGVIPLWNPFLLWGFPSQIILNYFGFANPLWMLTLLLTFGGIHVYSAFVYCVVFYFLIGQGGFYLLAREVLKDSRVAYYAFLLSLFSSSGLIQLNQFNMLLTFVPAVWFFYFLVRFCRLWDWLSWMGMIFTLMIIGHAYIPFYFLTVLILSSIGILFINPGFVKTIIVQSWKFFIQNIFSVILSLLVLGVSLIPAYLAYKSTLDHAVVLPCRQEGHEAFTQGAVFVHYAKTSDGGISSRMSFEDLFVNFNKMLYGNDGFFYVSGFVYLILIMGALNPIRRQMIFWGLMSTVLLLITLGKSTPVHQFLFEHLAYFRLMRNMHFFLPFLLTTVILFAMVQWKYFQEWSQKINWPQKGFIMVFVIVVHFGVVLFLCRYPNVWWETYLTVGLSGVCFILVIIQHSLVNRFVLPVLVFGAIILQPLAVINAHQQIIDDPVSPTIRKGMAIAHVSPKFSFFRIDENFGGQSEFEKINRFYWYYAAMMDAPMIPLDCQHGFPAFWSYFVYKNFPNEILKEYTRYKFFVYDNVALHAPETENFVDLIDALKEKKNLAFVATDRLAVQQELSALLNGSKSKLTNQALAITGPSPLLVVRDFDANSIILTTDFKTEKFLVYNDSYLPGWEARCNGKTVPVYRANAAFKGILLPAGRNNIEFTYHPWGGTRLGYLMILLFAGSFVYLTFLVFKKWSD